MNELLVAYDNSAPATAALAWAIDDANVRRRAVHLVYVTSSFLEWELAAVQVHPDPLRRRLTTLLATEWSAPLRDAGVPYSTEPVVGRPADAILDVARARDVEVIVRGLSTRGMLHELLAGTAMRHVLHDARRPGVAMPAGWEPAHP